MIMPVDRRSVLKAVAASVAAGLASTGGGRALAQTDGLKLGKPAAFSFDKLKDMAKRVAAAPYASPPKPAPEIVGKIDYDAWGKIKFATDHAVFADGGGRFPITFFHLGQFFQKSVSISLSRTVRRARSSTIPAISTCRPIRSPTSCRRAPDSRVPRPGSARRQARLAQERLGGVPRASYFRAIGALAQYGLSARGLAIDTAVGGKPEDFPDFTRFYIDSPETEDGVTIYALLDSASAVGAYRFGLTRGSGVLMDIDASVILRKPVTRFGLAPVTSMYWTRKR